MESKGKEVAVESKGKEVTAESKGKGKGKGGKVEVNGKAFVVCLLLLVIALKSHIILMQDRWIKFEKGLFIHNAISFKTLLGTLGIYR